MERARRPASLYLRRVRGVADASPDLPQGQALMPRGGRARGKPRGHMAVTRTTRAFIYREVRRDRTGKINPRGRTRTVVAYPRQTGRRLVTLPDGSKISTRGKRGKALKPLLDFLEKQGLLPGGNLTAEQIHDLEETAHSGGRPARSFGAGVGEPEPEPKRKRKRKKKRKRKRKKKRRRGDGPSTRKS